MTVLSYLLNSNQFNQAVTAFNVYCQLARMNPAVPFPAEHAKKLKNSLLQMSLGDLEEEVFNRKLLGELSDYLQLLAIQLAPGRISEIAMKEELEFIDQLFKKINGKIVLVNQLLMLYQTHLINPMALNEVGYQQNLIAQACVNKFISLLTTDILISSQEKDALINRLISFLLLMAETDIEGNRYLEITSQIINKIDKLILPNQRSAILGRFNSILRERNPQLSEVIRNLLPLAEPNTQAFDIDRDLFLSDAWEKCSPEKISFHLEVLYKKEMTPNEQLNFISALGKVTSNTKNNPERAPTTDAKYFLLRFKDDPNREEIFIRFLQSEYANLPKLTRTEKNYPDDYSYAYEEVVVEYPDETLLDEHIAFFLSIGLSLDKIKNALPLKNRMERFDVYYPLFEDELQILSNSSDETGLPIMLHTWSILASEEDRNVFFQGYSNLSETAGENPLNGIASERINSIFMILGPETADFLNNVMIASNMNSINELLEEISWNYNFLSYLEGLTNALQKLKDCGKIKENPLGFFQLIRDISEPMNGNDVIFELKSKIGDFISKNIKMENYITLIEISKTFDLTTPNAQPLADGYRELRESYNKNAQAGNYTFADFVYANRAYLELFSQAVGPEGVILLKEFLDFFGLQKFNMLFYGLGSCLNAEAINQLYKKIPSPRAKESLDQYFFIISHKDFENYSSIADSNLSLENCSCAMELAMFDLLDISSTRNLETSVDEYKKLAEEFEKNHSNNKNRNQPENLLEIMGRHKDKIKVLAKIFGIDVFSILRNKLSHSTERFESFLDNLFIAQGYSEELYDHLNKLSEANRDSILKDSTAFIKIAELSFLALELGADQGSLNNILVPPVRLEDVEDKLFNIIIEKKIPSLGPSKALHDRSVIIFKQIFDFFGVIQLVNLLENYSTNNFTTEIITELYKRIPEPATKESLEQFLGILSKFTFQQYEYILKSDFTAEEYSFAAKHWNPNLVLLSDNTGLVKLIKDFKILNEKFEKLDSKVRNRDQHGRFFDTMMSQNENKIQHLSIIFGKDVFTILDKHLTTSTLALERFLENLIINRNYPEAINSSLIKVYTQHHKEILTDPKVFLKIWELMVLAYVEYFTDQESLRTMLNPAASLIQMESQVNNLVIGKLNQSLGSELSDSDIERISKRIPPHLLIRLIVASSRMEGEFLLTIFNEFLLCDLTGKPFGEKNESEQLKLLRAHNENIRKELVAVGIKPELALKYVKKSNFFIAETRGSVDVEAIAAAFWAAMQKLYSLEPNLKTMIGNFQKALLGDKETKNGVPETLTPQQQIALFKKIESFNKAKDNKLDQFIQSITRIIEADRKKNPNSQDEKYRSIDEFFGHLKKEAESMRNIQEKPLEKTRRKAFEVGVWDKTRFDTFDLGTQVGCCLAPDGGQFPAMVQRRMDDGMFMHVVTDTTDPQHPKPISLAWLYFARDKSHPQDVYVVANFFEIAASYGRDPQLRDTIVAHLQEYIGQYAKDIGAKGFLMNHLTYGHIPNFQGYTQKNIQFEKVGGFLELNDSSEPYYLQSLNNSQFHVFHSSKPEQQQTATAAPVRMSQITNTASSPTATPSTSNGPPMQ